MKAEFNNSTINHAAVQTAITGPTVIKLFEYENELKCKISLP